jgi:hypothetical protein
MASHSFLALTSTLAFYIMELITAVKNYDTGPGVDLIKLYFSKFTYYFCKLEQRDKLFTKV